MSVTVDVQYSGRNAQVSTCRWDTDRMVTFLFVSDRKEEEGRPEVEELYNRRNSHKAKANQKKAVKKEKVNI